MKARGRAYKAPIFMDTLLKESVIDFPADHNNHARFIRRIEDALRHLRDRGVIGLYSHSDYPEQSGHAFCREWLQICWQILPPGAIIEALQSATNPETKRSAGTRAA